jgi:stage III sporulation protein AG
MDIIKKVKEIIAGQSRKKLVENTAIVIIIGIIIIVAGNIIFSGGKSGQIENEQQKTTNAVDGSKQAVNEGSDEEARLRTLLSQMKGVGKVDVMITYSTTRENVPAYDIKKNQSSTEEKDSEGGTRSITQEEYDSSMAYEDSPAGGKSPVILKELQPEVKGVLVVAEGADSYEVREQIVNAVKVVLDIPVHKVQVLQRKK